MTKPFPERAKKIALEQEWHTPNVLSPDNAVLTAEQVYHLIDTLLTEAYEEFEREIGGKRVCDSDEGGGNAYCNGYSQARTKALEAARKTLLGKE